MYTKFESLPQERREAILNAAIDEFAAKGYEKASTNEIVKAAAISKGLLFHYFQNKKQLFLYVFRFVVDSTSKKFYEKIDLSNHDLISRLEQAVQMKMEMMKQYPNIFHFIEAVYLDSSSGIFDEILMHMEEYMAATQPIFQDIEPSLFRNQSDIDKQIKMIYWTIEGLSRRYAYLAKNAVISLDDFYQDAVAEVTEYLQLLRKIYYQ